MKTKNITIYHILSDPLKVSTLFNISKLLLLNINYFYKYFIISIIIYNLFIYLNKPYITFESNLLLSAKKLDWSEVNLWSG